MATKPLSLSEVTNNYGTYQGNSLVGERGSTATVPNDGLEGIIGVNYPFLSGIIVKINGASYTYSGYLNQLKLQGNPFVSKSTIPTISFTLDQLVNTPIPDTIVYGSTTRTVYSEANVTKRMSTIEDILFYLNDFFNPNTSDIVLSPITIGGWTLNTTDYNVDLDVNGIYPGLEFEEYDGLKGIVRPSLPPSQTEPKVPDPEPIIELPPKKDPIVVKPKLPPPIDLPAPPRDEEPPPLPVEPIDPGDPWKPFPPRDSQPGDDIGPDPRDPIGLQPGDDVVIPSSIPRGSGTSNLSEYELQELMRPTIRIGRRN